MKSKFLLLFLSLFMVVGGVKAGDTYYSKAVAKAVGEGKVYVTTSQNSSKNYQPTSEANTSDSNQSKGSNKTYHFYAQQPAESNINVTYMGWFDNEHCAGSALTTEYNLLNQTITSATKEDDATLYRYAAFVDIQNHIVNPNGNFAPERGWTPTKSQTGQIVYNGGNGPDETPGFFELKGEWKENVSFDVKMSQTIQNLPSGYYRLSAYTQTAVGTTLTLRAGSNEVVTESKGTGWTEYEVITNVTNGSLNIEAQAVCTGADWQWANVDNFRLTYLGDTKASLSCKAGKYSTFVAPFDVTLPGNVSAWVLDGVEGTKITLGESPTGSKVAANTPVIIYNDGTTDPATAIYYGDDEGEHVDQAIAGEASLVGQYSSEGTVPTGAYVLQTQKGVQGFYRVGSTPVDRVANRCYLSVPSGSSVKAFSVGDDVDAIEAIKALTSDDAQVYDINGRKLDRLQKGVNIVNGHKIMVK